MSVGAVLAHEYYGHRIRRDLYLSKKEIKIYEDESFASLQAAYNSPGLTDVERAMLVQDAIDRYAEAQVEPIITNEMREILYKIN